MVQVKVTITTNDGDVLDYFHVQHDSNTVEQLSNLVHNLMSMKLDVVEDGE